MPAAFIWVIFLMCLNLFGNLRVALGHMSKPMSAEVEKYIATSRLITGTMTLVWFLWAAGQI